MGPRFRRRPWRAILFGIVFSAIAIGRFLSGTHHKQGPDSLREGTYRVARVVDGDTFLLANGARVRLMGVDTPETVRPEHPVEKWGPEASDFTRDFLADGEVRLQFDRERLDQYGRFLAYVYVGQRMLNEELLRAGLARAKLTFRYREPMKRRFEQAQAEARAAQRGIWSTPPKSSRPKSSSSPRSPATMLVARPGAW